MATRKRGGQKGNRNASGPHKAPRSAARKKFQKVTRKANRNKAKHALAKGAIRVAKAGVLVAVIRSASR